MDPLRAIADERGFFTRAHARAAGYDDRAVTREARSKRWHRIRRGYYTFPDLWLALDRVEQHLVLCRVIMDSLGESVALSHVSGCIVHGIDTWGARLDHVHVTRLDGGAGRAEAGVVHHEGLVTRDEVLMVDGLRVLPPARCAIEAGSLYSQESGLVLFNSGLHKGLFTSAELGTQFDRMAHWPKVRHLHIPIRMSNDKAESVGESRGLWLFYVQHLPCPEQQFEVWLDGVLVGRTDWAWPKIGTPRLGEFDGKVKYGRLLKRGQEPGDAVFAEKQREDKLREVTAWPMSRLVWSDYDTPDQTGARLRKLLR